MSAGFQLAVWGYCVLGDIIEQDALIAEERPDRSSGSIVRWDFTRRFLDQTAVDHGQGWEHPPEWRCLCYLPMAWREAAHEKRIYGVRIFDE